MLSLARELDLPVYDASYLELAMRSGVPLATHDQALANAADTAGVEPVLRPAEPPRPDAVEFEKFCSAAGFQTARTGGRKVSFLMKGRA